MSSLLRIAPTVQDQDPSAWPSWCDDDTWEIGPDPAEWPAICALLRRPGDAGAPARPGPTPLRAADLPAVQWFAAQVAWQRSRSEAEGDYADLLVTALNDVLCVLRDRRCPTAAALVALPGTAFTGIDLAGVRVPDEPRTSGLAGCLDDDVQYYLDLETDLGNLAAWAILRHADAAEWYGSDTLAQYLDDDAAWMATCDDMACEYPDNPLW